MILITGGAGFIGRNLVKNIISEDFNDIRIIAKNLTFARNIFPNLDVISIDISKGNLKDVLKDVDIVIHLAGLVDYKSEQKVFQANFETTRNLVKYCDRVDKFIFSSTVDVYGEIAGVVNEESEVKIDDIYAKSKYMAEETIINSGIPSVTLRISPVYGVGAHWWKIILDFLSIGFVPETKNLTQLIHISDVVNALKCCIKRGKGTYIIADKDPILIQGFSENLVELLGKKPISVPLQFLELGTRIIGLEPLFNILIKNRSFDISKSEKELKFIPQANFEDEIKNMIEWYKEESGNEFLLEKS